MTQELEKLPTIKNLADDVRQKALEYAESLGARGPRPTTALGTAVTLAKEWKSGRLPPRPVSPPFLVQPRFGRWLIKRSNESAASHTFIKKDDAVRRAQALAKKAGAACFVFGPGGTLIERYEAQRERPPAPPAPPVLVEAPAPEPEPEPVVIAPEPEPIAPEPVAEVSEPPALPYELEPEPEEVEPIRMRKVRRRWCIVVGDGRTEIHASKKKAFTRVKALSKRLGRPWVID